MGLAQELLLTQVPGLKPEGGGLCYEQWKLVSG